MGKKKKKNTNKNSNSNNTPSSLQTISNIEENCQDVKGRKRQGLVVKIHCDGTNSGGGSSNGRTTIKGENERILYINESDADCLTVSNNDFVIVTEVKAEEEEELEDIENVSQRIIWNNSDAADDSSPQQPKFISVCKIKVVRSSSSRINNSKTTFSSPKSPKNKNNDKNVNQGEAKIYPISLSQRIFHKNEKENQSIQWLFSTLKC